MQNPAPLALYDDEIDLRAVFQTLWKGRTLILILTLVAAATAYAISAWALPKQYQASAYVTIALPRIQYLTTASGLTLNIAAANPDIKAIPDLIKEETVLYEVTADPRIAPAISIETLSGQIQVTTLGTSQLKLQVTDSNPQRAAALATVWAEQAANWIEINYGFNGFTSTLNDQIVVAKQAYEESQTALENFAAINQTPILLARLTAQEDIYTCLEKQILQITALNHRLTNLKEQIPPVEETISLTHAILLESIEHDFDSITSCDAAAVVSQSSAVVALNTSDTKEILSVIASLQEALTQKLTSASITKESLEEQIPQLSVELEHATYQLNQYTQQRDQASGVYEQLAYRKMLLLQQSERTAYVRAKAKAPSVASAPSPPLNAVAAGALGFIVGATAALSAEWRKKQGAEAGDKI